MEKYQNKGALQGNQAGTTPAVYFAGLDSAMADFPVQPELFSSAGEWFKACRNAMIDIPAQLGHALSQVEKEQGSAGRIRSTCCDRTNTSKSGLPSSSAFV